MYIDEEIFKKVLMNYGFTMEDVLNAAKKHKKDPAEADYIYLLHHMHAPEKGTGMEELHHCILFEKRNMKGKVFQQKHVREDKIFHHVVDLKASKVKNVEDVPATLYCHLNNGYKIRVKEINGKVYAEFVGMVSLEKTRWSEQDR